MTDDRGPEPTAAGDVPAEGSEATGAPAAPGTGAPAVRGTGASAAPQPDGATDTVEADAALEESAPDVLEPEPAAPAQEAADETAHAEPRRADAPLEESRPEEAPGEAPEAVPGAAEPAPAAVPEPSVPASPVAPAAVPEPSVAAPPEASAAAPAPASDAALPSDAAMPPEAALPSEAATPAAPRTVARLVAETIRAAGVKFAFTVPGESFLPLLEALGAAGVRVVATHHESGAAFMAEAYGQLTGRPAACLATRAVGAANLAIGIHTARADSTAMFALVGQVTRGVRGREAFQEVDVASTIGGLASWAGEIDRPDQARSALADAVRHALGGRPGPVVLAIAEDALDEPVPSDASVATLRPTTPRLDPGAIRSILQLLASAERPAILAGAGVLRSRASRDLVRFAELLRVPVLASWRRGDVFPNEHPLYLGMTGYGAPPTVRDRLERADALLVIGCRLNEPTSFGYAVPRPGLRWGHVDLEPRGAGAGLRAPDVAIASDSGVFLRAAIARLEQGVLDAERADARDAANAEDRSAWEAAAVVDRGAWSGPGVHPGRAVATVRGVLGDDAILVTDAGNFGTWFARGYRFRRPATLLGPTSGAMGYAVPAAVAAAIVHRDRPVVAIAGDGGFAMTMAEVETAVRERVRPLFLVFDNERYGTIRMHQDRRGSGQGIGTELGPIDFARVAEGLGAYGVRVERDDDLEPALRAALSADRPTVVHIRLDRAWVSVDETPV